MKSEDFKDWRKQMGFNQTEAAKSLGLSRSAIEQYETGIRKADGKPAIIPFHIGLACAAIATNLKPWGEFEAET